ncbi:SpoIID/LytB domain-containing protein [Trichlorobacter ammonificans]|uniref:SpoIID/LytB domain protein n=1 Tax=Trichlorobacter ammonificans TaxID=2916410 RepID=A0ABM9D8V9_9BACT|nr:SpoIID/LytB domain-containing protein [Trichlorobacter ammonificans]CAH2031652.1 SpoIID/LytB domain protein [Trichlorobacter ammonificans]
MRLLILFIAVLLSVTFPPEMPVLHAQPLSGNLIRVAILKGADSVTIDGTGVLALPDTGAAMALEPPFTVRSSGNRLLLNGLSCRTIRLSTPDRIKINGKSYRGLVELVAQGNGLLVINELPLEEYLVGVINSEISSTWPMEVIKVQAIIARTYAVAKRQERRTALFHLESTVLDQAYDGSDLEDSRAARGVHETEGQVLTYRGTVIQAFYHANSGGKTEASQNVWGMSLPYLQGVDCQYGATGSSSTWELSLPLSRIENALRAAGQKIGRISDIKTGPRNNRDRLINVLLVTDRGTVSMPATRFRMAVGSTVVKSTNFTVRVDNGTALFNGLGYGHGVGLCQWGARQRALDGFSYTEILSYYYPGTKLSMLSELRFK